LESLDAISSHNTFVFFLMKKEAILKFFPIPHRTVFPKLCVATSWGGAELRQGRRQKLEKTEKKKDYNFCFFIF
jgi:hypothetical protein